MQKVEKGNLVMKIKIDAKKWKKGNLMIYRCAALPWAAGPCNVNISFYKIYLFNLLGDSEKYAMESISISTSISTSNSISISR